jgi:hypothetical protein
MRRYWQKARDGRAVERSRNRVNLAVKNAVYKSKNEELFKPMPNLHLLRRKKRMTVRDEKILYSSLDKLRSQYLTDECRHDDID